MIYFTSDIHLRTGSPEVEQRFLRWLDEVSRDAEAIYILGDLFDFWFEWRRVIPKTSIRVLGKLASLADRGVRIIFLAGNHDLWVREYLAAECGFEIYTSPQIMEMAGKRVLLAHGDDIAREGRKVRILNRFFRSKRAHAWFSRLVHPDTAMRFGLWWSDKSRDKPRRDLPIEPFVEYARSHNVDCAVFGHLHIPYQKESVVFLGDWDKCPAYATMNDKGELKLCEFI